MHEKINERLDNWDIAKEIFQYIAEMNLLKDFPNIDLKKLMFDMSHEQIIKLAEVVTGEPTDSLKIAIQAVTYFLAVIFNKIINEPGFLDLLRVITVIPLQPIPEIKNSTEPDLSTN